MSSIARWSCIFAFSHHYRMITWLRHMPLMSPDLPQPFPTSSDQFRPLLVISDLFHFQLTSCTYFPLRNTIATHRAAPRSFIIQYAVAETTGISNCEAASSLSLQPDIGMAIRRYREGHVIVWKELWARCGYCFVGLLHLLLRSFVWAVKFICGRRFILKFHTIYILPCTYQKNK